MPEFTRGDVSSIPRPETRLRPESEDDDEDDEPVRGELSSRRFAAVLGVSTAVMVFALTTFLGVGMVAGAMLGPGLGGFVAEFDDVSYTDGDAEIYPTLAEHAACDDAPQLEVSLEGETTLQGDVSFYKDLPLPDQFNAADGIDDAMARVAIQAAAPDGGIDVDDLDLRLTVLQAETIELGDSAVREFGPDAYDDGSTNASYSPTGEGSLDPSDDETLVPEFGVDATFFNLPDGGTAAAHQVSFSSIDLQDLDLFIAIDDRDSFANPVERVVEPTERECEALADS